ncbi:nitroreductase family protein [Williamsia sp. CHRR-6]|uniref:nitroreductase family protein n=1 Tax=Williamsia sp. CHRR-6 TaxID=2835871 RepID=UPI001BDA735B|nr:nitroreductase family protein [Williamsia sp. CHRR-6]MBT0565945.1 nitroreductase family protein [Williamsia sp. CHRR-6]
MGPMATLDLTPDELLTTTRTVRKRLDLDTPVPMAVIRECLEIALQAPSGSNMQGWQWIVVTDPQQRRRIGDIYREQTQAYLDSRISVTKQFVDDPDRSKVQKRIGTSVEYLGENMGKVPVLLIPCIRGGREMNLAGQAAVWGSLFPAVWSYMLAARARGLGTAWTTLHLMRDAEVAEILGIPDDFLQGALIPTAYYTGETFKPAPRAPLDDVLHIDRW